MSGGKTSTSKLGLLVLLAGSAGTLFGADYFPLHTGNQWIYRGTGNSQQLVTIQITGTESIGGRTYAKLTGFFGREALLRMSEDGVLYAWDSETNSERVWHAFETPEGGQYNTGIDNCSGQARIRSRNAEYSGPVGESRDALDIGFVPGNCADAGLEREIYLPYVGLVQRTEQSIAGPRTFELLYARIGGVTVLAGKELSFAVQLDRYVFESGEDGEQTVRLTLRNTTAQPLELTFPSGQLFNLAVRNEAGNSVYNWAANKLFPAVVIVERIEGERNWVLTAPLSSLPPGKYVAEAWLTTEGPRRFVASVAFQVASRWFDTAEFKP